MLIEPVDLVIFGKHTAKWTAALSPDAPVWRDMPSVRSVRILDEACSSQHVSELPAGSILVPLMERHALAKPRGFRGLSPSDEAVQILGNKYLFSRYLSDQRLSHFAPKNYRLDGQVEVPCVVKRVDLNAGNGIVVAHSHTELYELLEDERWRGHDVVIQEAVPGCEDFVTHCVCVRGKIVWSCSFRFELPQAMTIRGHATPARSNYFHTAQATLQQFEEILAPLGYSGPCNFDYKLRLNGGVCVFEVNPRMGGSLLVEKNTPHLRAMFEAIIAHAANQQSEQALEGL